jgi:ATP-dependent Zn protease
MKLDNKTVAYHEAGHAVAGHALEVALSSATIIPSEDASGKVRHNALRGVDLGYDNSDRARRQAERLIMMALAGPIAQKKHNPTSRLRWHGEHDFKVASEIAERVCSSAEEAAAFLRWLKVRTKNLVHTPLRWFQIEHVAAALQQHGTLSKKQFKQEIQAATEAWLQRNR